jgi:hypothetical protein
MSSTPNFDLCELVDKKAHDTGINKYNGFGVKMEGMPKFY